MPKRNILIAILVIVALTLACGESGNGTISETVPSDAGVTVEATAAGPSPIEETATSEIAGATPEEAEVIDTPEPTATPVPTDTPQPTATPEPIILEGTGDSVVDVSKGDSPAIAHIVGNEAGTYFGVTSLDEQNELVDLLVNTTDPYDGIRPIDFDGFQTTARFEIQATGPWRIEVLPLSAARTVAVPGRIEGEGDDVIILTGNQPRTFSASGNADASYFGVVSYGAGSSGVLDLLVNTTDPYEGSRAIDPDSTKLVIQAAGPWTIELSD